MSVSDDPTAAATAFDRGEDLSFAFVVRDGTGAVLDLSGGMLAMELWWRGACRVTLAAGAGLTVADPHPPQAAAGAPQTPHGTARLTAVQTAAIPPGRVATFRTRFTDATGRVTLSPFAFLDGAVAGGSAVAVLGGGQGPAGPPILTVASFAAVPATGPARIVAVSADETNGGFTTLYLQTGAALAWLPSIEVIR